MLTAGAGLQAKLSITRFLPVGEANPDLSVHTQAMRCCGLVPVPCLQQAAGAGEPGMYSPGRDGALSAALGHMCISGIDRLE